MHYLTEIPFRPMQVFIMGFGAIGRDLAKRLRPFGVRILATKRSWALEQPESNQSNGMR